MRYPCEICECLTESGEDCPQCGGEVVHLDDIPPAPSLKPSNPPPAIPPPALTLPSAVMSRRNEPSPNTNTMHNTTLHCSCGASYNILDHCPFCGSSDLATTPFPVEVQWNAEVQDAVWHLAPEFGMTHLTARDDGSFAVLRNNTDAPSVFHHPEVWNHALDLYHADGNREAIECLIVG